MPSAKRVQEVQCGPALDLLCFDGHADRGEDQRPRRRVAHGGPRAEFGATVFIMACVFCGRAGKLTNEHVFPQWLLDVIPGKGNVVHVWIAPEGSDSEDREWTTDIFDFKAKVVCEARGELSIHKAQTRFAGPEDFVFPTEHGRRQDHNNARRRVVVKAVERANENLTRRGRNPLPEGITPHSLRRTFISLLLATGAEVPYVMRQVGHTDPKVTLSIYAQVMYRGEGERERLKVVSEGSDWALGTGGDFEVPEPGEQLTLDAAESRSTAGDSADGRGWARTSDLSRVRGALSH